MVFDGTGSPYRSTDQTNPLSEYGKQKLEAEKQVLKVTDQNLVVLRITLLNGNSPRGDRSPHERILNALAQGQTPNLFTDEYRQTSSAENVAQLLVELVERPNLNGLFHWCGSEVVTRYELGKQILQKFGLNEKQLHAASLKEAEATFGERPAHAFELAPLVSKVKAALPWSNNWMRCIQPAFIRGTVAWMILHATPRGFKWSISFSFRKETGPENMATDMWLLNRFEQWQGQVFRRYGWSVPQVAFGYGQKADWVEQETGLSLSSLTTDEMRRNCSSWKGPDLCLIAPG